MTATFSRLIVHALLTQQLIGRLPDRLQRAHAHVQLLQQRRVVGHLIAQLVGVRRHRLGSIHLLRRDAQRLLELLELLREL